MYVPQGVYDQHNSYKKWQLPTCDCSENVLKCVGICVLVMIKIVWICKIWLKEKWFLNGDAVVYSPRLTATFQKQVFMLLAILKCSVRFSQQFCSCEIVFACILTADISKALWFWKVPHQRQRCEKFVSCTLSSKHFVIALHARFLCQISHWIWPFKDNWNR